MRERLRACIDALRRSTEPVDVVVVDNASTDGTSELVRSRFPQATLISNATNRGFAAACNQGLALVRTPYVLLLNPDTEVEPVAVGALKRMLECRPAVGAAGPKIVRPDGSLDLASRRQFPSPSLAFFRLTRLDRLFPDNPRVAGYNLRHLPADIEQEVDSGTGACLLVRQAALQQVGGLDEAFFMYGEDLDLCFRLKAAAWKVMYVPSATVLHYKGASSRQASYRMIREFHRSMAIFFEKHYAKTTPLPLRWLIHLGINLRCAAQLALNLQRRQKRVSK